MYIIFLVSSLLWVWILNTALYISVKRRPKPIAILDNNRKQLEVALATTVQYIVIAFSMAILPSTVSVGVGTITSLDPNSPNFNPLGIATWTGFSYLASRILLANSFINCIIYGYRSKDFRSALKTFLCCNHISSKRLSS